MMLPLSPGPVCNVSVNVSVNVNAALALTLHHNPRLDPNLTLTQELEYQASLKELTGRNAAQMEVPWSLTEYQSRWQPLL